MKVVERYLAREIHGATALVMAAFLVLFAFFDLIAEIQNLGRGSYQLFEALEFVTLTLPGRVYELAPIAVLIGLLSHRVLGPALLRIAAQKAEEVSK